MNLRTLDNARSRPLKSHLSLGTVGAMPATLGAATFPSYLPHRPVSLGIMIAVCWVVGRSVTEAMARRFARRSRQPSWQRALRRDGPIRTTALSGCVVATIALFGEALRTQNSLRTELGMDQITTRELAVSGSVAAVILGGLSVVRRVAHQIDGRRTLAVAVVSGSVLAVVYPLRVSTEPPTTQTQILLQESDSGAARAYASLADEPEVERRAGLAAERLVRSGGLDREHLVLVVPTGSGWVDTRLVRGLEKRFGSEVATVSMQYDDRPSWLSFLIGRDEAAVGARALFGAVLHRVEALPAADRPQVHLVGESLGATAGQDIFRGPSGVANRDRVCSVMWVGTPGGGSVGMANEAVVANPSDPVVHAHPSMLVKPPDDDRPWLPVISFVQASADYAGSLAVPDGAGHRYGEEQAHSLPTC